MTRELPAKPEWLKPLFPWEQHSITVNGRAMAYVDEGDPKARPVLLLHGNPTWGFLYRDFIGLLTEAGYRAIVPDWIGAGYSDNPRIDTALTFAHHIADLVSLMDQLRLRGFVIVGQDWGGPQGVGAALQRVERLDAIVLMNTWLFTGYVGRFHSSPRPWTTWHAPLIGQFFMKRHKVLSLEGPSAVSPKYIFANEQHETSKLVADVAGGIASTVFNYKDWMNPEERPFIEKYLAGKNGIPTEHRLRATRLVKDLIGHGHDGAFIHTEGSLAAQKMAMYAAAPWERYKAIAKRIAQIPGWEEHPDLKELPPWPTKWVI